MIFKVLADAFLVNLSFIFAYYLRFKVFVFITPSSAPIFGKYLGILIFITIIWLAVFKLVGLYENKKFTALVDEIAMLFVGVVASTLVLLGLLFLNREFWFSRLLVANAGIIAFLAIGLGRILSFWLVRFLKLKGVKVKNVLILGAGDIGLTLADKMLHDKYLGYSLKGFLDDDPQKVGTSINGVRVLGKLIDCKDIIKKLKIDEIIISFSSISDQRILDIITECEKLRVEFKLVPGILELIASRIDTDEIAGIPLLTVSEIRLKGLSAILKRTADLILSGIGLVILLPLFVVVSILIKLTSPGPVFCVQKRIGIEEQPFMMIKFRSMVENADKLLPDLQPLSEAKGHLFKIKNDPRLTPIGSFIRHYSIDELPQLINVFLGHMSLVGPRPPLTHEVEKYNAWEKKRLRVRPGITGSWQVSGRSLLPFDDMVRLDIYYIENWSLWLDLKILFRTIPVVILGKGAY